MMGWVQWGRRNALLIAGQAGSRLCGAGRVACLQALRAGFRGAAIRPLIGSSADALAVSNRRTVGAHPIRAGLVRGPGGSKAPWSMGWGQGKGSAKAPFPVSMKWSGVLGAGTPSSRWVQGERNLPASGQPAIRLDGAGTGSIPWKRQGRGDATGVRSGPLAKMVLYYNTHLARAPKAVMGK